MALILGIERSLKISKIASCRKIFDFILRERDFVSFKDAFCHFYGTHLFHSFPKGIRNSLFHEYFIEGKYYELLCEKYLPSDCLLEEEEVSQILSPKGFDVKTIYSFYIINYCQEYKEIENKLKQMPVDFDILKILPKEERKRQKMLNYILIYYQTLDEALEEKRIAVKYLLRLQEAYQKKGISYLDSLSLLPKNQLLFLQSSRLHPKDIYAYFLKGLHGEGKEEGEL